MWLFIVCTVVSMVLAIVTVVETLVKGQQAAILPFLTSVAEVLGLKELVSSAFSAALLAIIIAAYALLSLIPPSVIFIGWFAISTLRMPNETLDAMHSSLAAEKLEDVRLVLGLKKLKNQ